MRLLTKEEKEKFNIKHDPPTDLKCQECGKDSNNTEFKNIYWIPYNEHGLKYEGWLVVCRPCQIITESMILNIGKIFKGVL